MTLFIDKTTHEKSLVLMNQKPGSQEPHFRALYPKTPLQLSQMVKSAWEAYYKSDIERILEDIHQFLNQLEAESYVVSAYNTNALDAAIVDALYKGSSNKRKSYRCLR